jgi:hypothetical protein
MLQSGLSPIVKIKLIFLVNSYLPFPAASVIYLHILTPNDTFMCFKQNKYSRAIATRIFP